MSALAYVNQYVLPASLGLLPPRLGSPQARAMMLAICLQESRFEARRQLVGSPPRPVGPAMGFGQFERGGGVTGVLIHPSTRRYILPVLDAMQYDHEPETSWLAIQHNDILAMVYVRLNLWWLPNPLPERGQHEVAWGQYLDAWRPGKPHRGTWDSFFDQAWGMI